MDLATRRLAPAELRRFAVAVGAPALLDASGRAYRDQGLGYMRLTDEEIAARLLERPQLLRLPLIRCANEVSVGMDEPAWNRWLAG